MSYPRLFKELPTQRFVAAYSARTSARYHGLRIAELLATKLGTRPRYILPFMPPVLAREAARGLSRGISQGAGRSAAAFLDLLRSGEASPDDVGK